MKSQSLLTSIHPATVPDSLASHERAEIDASTRGPVLLFFGCSVFWLLVGSLLGLVAAWKMTHPGLLDSMAWLTFGRIRPAHLNVVVYGWAFQAGIGVALWLMARLCRIPLLHAKLLVSATLFWNLGVLIGVLGILAGDSRSVEWLELPGYATPILFLAYACIGVWAVIMFRYRRPGHVYVSQWYLLAAFLWFPWLYATANILLIWQPVQGSAQGAVNWWFARNVLGLWLTPIGLASAFYMIPKVLGRPIHSYYLSLLGFWALALFYSWNGMHHLIGGPFPAWMISASVVASILMIIPVITVAINHHMTMKGHFEALKWSPTLRFTVFGAMAYTVVSLQGCLMAIPSLNTITHFTDYTIGHAHLGLYGFFSMMMFGAIYYIVPRLVGWEWPSATMIRWHFWLAATGVLLMVGALTIGGLLQGLALYDPKVSFQSSLDFATPFRWVRGISGFLLLAGHLVFACLFVQMLLKIGHRRTGPALFTESKTEAASL
ncbi:MAG: cbb3-type cytochrome c oxidase subunit I [Chthoniobacterales bacterium]|nr:cbb3-type cytochrome c oxidase subunit I [Chthoniobacterales bacterium]